MLSIAQIADMLMVEKENNLCKQQQCIKEVAELPKGSIYCRKTLYEESFYHNYYCPEAKKGIIKYIKDKSIVPTMREQIARRKQLEKTLKEIEKDIETIEKMLTLAKNRIQHGSLREDLKEVSATKDTNENLSSQMIGLNPIDNNANGEVPRN